MFLHFYPKRYSINLLLQARLAPDGSREADLTAVLEDVQALLGKVR